MRGPYRTFTASEAARSLGISIKALRLYERRGLVTPVRTAAGWRVYGDAEMECAAQTVALRSLGFSLALISRLLKGETSGIEPALDEHRRLLEAQLKHTSQRIDLVNDLRTRLKRDDAPSLSELCCLCESEREPAITFELPWPWGGETFELSRVRMLNYIVGPLFSGKTRLARLIADRLPNSRFVGLDRLETDHQQDAVSHQRIEDALSWLVNDGATPSSALSALVTALEGQPWDHLVIDMVEQGLDADTQAAVASYLRRSRVGAPRIFVLTRSNAILDLLSLGADETLLFCPANHSPPFYVTPTPGALGYEAVANCLASPDVRARTAGVTAVMSSAA